MFEYRRTDLAWEWSRDKGECVEIDGTRRQVASWENGDMETFCICTSEAARRMGRPQGEYVSVRCGAMWKLDGEVSERLERVIARLLLRLIKKETERAPGGDLSVLIVGLGNEQITADALGPAAIKEVLVTRHLKEHEPELFHRMGCCAVSALVPGVLGQTGMEAADIVAGAVRRCHADVVIAVDALAAQNCERLAATVQLSNVGIEPGSGVGNHRAALNKSFLGVPVIALGIPTVVDSSTLVYDALCRAGITDIDSDLRSILDNGRRFYVSPREADEITRRSSQTVARAINRALVGVAHA